MSVPAPYLTPGLDLAPAPAPLVPAQRGPETWLQNLHVAAEIAKAVADTEFVPKWCRHNVPAVAAVMMKGLELGLPPLASLHGIVLVDGRPLLYTDTQRGLIWAAGHEIWLEEYGVIKATWCGRRRGAERVWRMTFTIEDARTARLTQKPVWQAYPAAMLSARSFASLAKAAFSDVLGGLEAAEEFDLIDPRTVAGEPEPAERPQRRQRPEAAGPAMAASTPAQVPAGPSARGRRAQPPLSRERGPVEAPPEEPEAEAVPMSNAQLRKLHAAFRERGITDREDKLRYCGVILGRDVPSSTALDGPEAARVIDSLQFKPKDLEPLASSVDDVMQAAAAQANPAVPPPASPPISSGDAPAAPPDPSEAAPEPPTGGAAGGPQDHEGFPESLEDLAPRVEQPELPGGSEASLALLRGALAKVPLADRNDLALLLMDAGFTAKAPSSNDLDRLADVLVTHFPDVTTPIHVLGLRNHLADAQRAAEEEDPE